MEIKWNEIEKVGFPEHSQTVWVAGEMKYLSDPMIGNKDGEMEYFVDMGWIDDDYEKYRLFRQNIPEDVDRWGTTNDWYEGQGYFKITHWAEIIKPKHPLTNEYLY